MRWGSSPLARGPQVCEVGVEHLVGLIPARAGTTETEDGYRYELKAHPRSRGDHFANFAPNSMRSGSSPLARGPPHLRAPRLQARGLIPARAGTTCVHAVSCRFPRAHPRSRGDH